MFREAKPFWVRRRASSARFRQMIFETWGPTIRAWSSWVPREPVEPVKITRRLGPVDVPFV